METSANVEAEMMRGFESLDSVFAKKPLTSGQALRLAMYRGLFGAMKYGYNPVKNLFGQKIDIREGIEAALGQRMKVRGTRTRESHGGHYLSQAEVAEFERTGILGPYPVISAQEAADLKRYAEELHARDFDNHILFGNERIRDVLKRNGMWNINYSGIYQALRYPRWWDLLASREITERLASLIGDDIICWRSQFFQKKPGEMGTFWHQTGTFRESSAKPKLQPTTPMDDSQVQLTAWIALSDVTIPNGCMRILPGSYCDGRFERMAYNIRDRAGEYLKTLPPAEAVKAVRALKYTAGNFLKAQLVYELALKEVPDLFDGYEVQDLEMKAGEFIIFTSLNTHGSYPNITPDDTRLAVAGRYTSNDVKVYEGFSKDVFSTPEGELPFDIDELACMQVLGEDRFGFNRMASHPGGETGKA